MFSGPGVETSVPWEVLKPMHAEPSHREQGVFTWYMLLSGRTIMVVWSGYKIQCVTKAPVERADTLIPSSQQQHLLMDSPGTISVSSKTIATDSYLWLRGLCVAKIKN